MDHQALRRAVLPTAAAMLLLLLPELTGASVCAQPDYPRVNVATGYEIDPDWPRRPDNMPWASMPGVFVDGKDQVWLFTRANPPVQVYDAKGNFVRAWGDGLVGSAHHIRRDHEGNVWLADYGDHVILKCSPEGKVLMVLGTKGEPGDDESHFNRPTDMAVTLAGDIFVSDGYDNARVVHFDKDGHFVKSWGTLGARPGQFSVVHAIALDSKGRLYVADRNNVRVQVFDQSGKLLDQWRNLIVPWGLWITEQDEIWVCGSSPMQWRKADRMVGIPPKDQILMKFDTTGRVLALWSVPQSARGQQKPGELRAVHAIAADSRGNLYVGDVGSPRAQKFVVRAGEPQ